MKHFIPLILLLILTGCCQVAQQPLWPMTGESITSSLYRFRLERSAETKFSGLLALKPREDGMWSVLLDATGIPLVKMLVHADGSRQIEYCAAALCDSRLPELLGNLIEYIYFIPANANCPWYAFFSVCLETDNQEQSVKWERFGPIRLWEVEQATTPAMQEKITVHMSLSSITVHLQRIDNEPGK